VRIALAEELRALEYSQRLTHQARNVLAAPGASVGTALYAAALAGGARALGRDCGALRPGTLADLVAIDREHAALAPLAAEQLLDGWVFAADDRVVREVWSAGRHVVRDGRHVGREAVEARYKRAMAGIVARA
jgi:formimidoylglutamate deiminase